MSSSLTNCRISIPLSRCLFFTTSCSYGLTNRSLITRSIYLAMQRAIRRAGLASRHMVCFAIRHAGIAIPALVTRNRRHARWNKGHLISWRFGGACRRCGTGRNGTRDLGDSTEWRDPYARNTVNTNAFIQFVNEALAIDSPSTNQLQSASVDSQSGALKDVAVEDILLRRMSKIR